MEVAGTDYVTQESTVAPLCSVLGSTVAPLLYCAVCYAPLNWPTNHLRGNTPHTKPDRPVTPNSSHILGNWRTRWPVNQIIPNYGRIPIFTESALRPIQSISRDVRLSVSLSVCPSHPRNHASRRIRDLWSKGVSLILAYP